MKVTFRGGGMLVSHYAMPCRHTVTLSVYAGHALHRFMLDSNQICPGWLPCSCSMTWGRSCTSSLIKTSLHAGLGHHLGGTALSVQRDHSPAQTDGCHSRCSRQYSLLSGMYANSQVSKLAPVMGIVYGCHMPAMQGRVPHHEPPVCYCCLLFMSLYNVKPECRQLINLVPASCGCRCC